METDIKQISDDFKTAMEVEILFGDLHKPRVFVLAHITHFMVHVPVDVREEFCKAVQAVLEGLKNEEFEDMEDVLSRIKEVSEGVKDEGQV